MIKIYGHEAIKTFYEAFKSRETIMVLGVGFVVREVGQQDMGSGHIDLIQVNPTVAQVSEPDQLRTVREALTVALGRVEDLERQLALTDTTENAQAALSDEQQHAFETCINGGTQMGWISDNDARAIRALNK